MTTGVRPQLAGALHWVRAELEHSVGRARGLIEHCVENDRDTMSLQQAFIELRQIRGTAQMIRCQGAVVLSNEMAAGLLDLMQGRVTDREPVYATLLAATIQL